MVNKVWETMAPYIHLKSDVNGHPTKTQRFRGGGGGMDWKNAGDDLQEISATDRDSQWARIYTNVIKASVKSRRSTRQDLDNS